ncbi:MAG TPA: hypothetical protein PLT08_14875, partial [Anaerolineales bacterium]|nr:hypothetical protein [Anaerolineales bacterium]
VWKIEIPDLLRFGISVATIVLTLAYAHIPFLQRFRFVLLWFAQGIGIINKLVDWLFMPIKGIFSLIAGLFSRPSNSQPAE